MKEMYDPESTALDDEKNSILDLVISDWRGLRNSPLSTLGTIRPLPAKSSFFGNVARGIASLNLFPNTEYTVYSPLVDTSIDDSLRRDWHTIGNDLVSIFLKHRENDKSIVKSSIQSGSRRNSVSFR
jgi:hypothetical protein